MKHVRILLLGALLLAAGCGDEGGRGQEGGEGGTGGAGGSGGTGGMGGTGGAPELPAIAWEEDEAPLPVAIDHHATWVSTTPAGTFLYAAGGATRVGGQVFRTEVHRALVAGDGSLGAWAETTALPVAQVAPAMAQVDRVIVLIGGLTESARGPRVDNLVQVGRVGDDGAIESWTEGPSLPANRFHAYAAASGRFVYVVGGVDGSFDATDTIYRTEVQENGTLADWTALADAPEAISHTALVVHDGFLYVVGGLSGNPFGAALAHGKVWRVPLEEDGDLGDWEPLGDLPDPRTVHGIALVAGHVVISGGVASEVEDDAVIAAPLAAGGLGEWKALDPLPFARAHTHQTPVVGDRVYSVAGFTDDDRSTDAVVIGTIE